MIIMKLLKSIKDALKGFWKRHKYCLIICFTVSALSLLFIVGTVLYDNLQGSFFIKSISFGNNKFLFSIISAIIYSPIYGKNSTK